MLNYCDLETWKLTLAEMTEILETFESLAPGIFAGFVVREWHKQPVFFQPEEELIYLKDLRGDYLLSDK